MQQAKTGQIRPIYRLFSANGVLRQPKAAERELLSALISLAVVGWRRLL